LRLLITGGCGFIGSNLIHLILDTLPEAEVTNLDKLTYAGNPLNLAGVADSDRYHFIRGDIADPTLVDDVIGAGHFDAVLNLAAESMVDRSIVSAAPFVNTNIVGTQALLDAALAHGVQRFVQVSTDEVYGSLGPQGEFTEESCLAPNNAYAASKASADLLCRAAFRTHGLPVTITRCSNNYGPRQFPEKLIPLMIQRALADEKLPVYGDGLHVRDWLYVDDHCRAILAVLDSGQPGEVYNVGGGTELPNIELVRMLLSALGKPESLISYVPDRPGHDRRYAVDATKIERELGWSPQQDFEAGLKRTIDWYLDNSSWLGSIADGSYQQVSLP
jgi:dTDP-glucose 4,6-dehydratase